MAAQVRLNGAQVPGSQGRRVSVIELRNKLVLAD